jgi:hypothetical protein
VSKGVKGGRVTGMAENRGRNPGHDKALKFRVGFFFCILWTRGDLEGRAWELIPQDVWTSEATRQIVVDFNRWQATSDGRKYAMTIFSADGTMTFTPLGPIDQARFFVRHPKQTLQVVVTLGDAHAQAEAEL